MGLHQDRDEKALDAPVASISLGDSCLFRFGGSTRGGPTKSIRLESGDLVIPLKERPGAAFPAVEFADVLAGRIPGRTTPDQITIFKSNGLAIQDVVAAGYVFEQTA
jgi:hypothetical protein